ncbi:hypothetical protein JY506_07000 [Corynebacterium amycolatum]|uniref:hypothetical protein n=1 Tax=Corynebacterium TaxID=1716 RepID=UPI00065FD11F|nr:MULTISPECIES: hypothetical protein [Corynebacterium]KAA0881446.1 hypothetical protein E7L51_07615 [Corynebacterium amycolatum]MCQ9128641.1 hypothetical protein [Corynebacterium amycolatum]MCQ9140953.1 hypothetical protein [Corynebacterium amycolatum]MCQ9172071.1 hypothetical protein [Corynebacterium amycolatum]OHR29475.1 hypothetical protein HMPREF2985_05905 [Corynebacterium sp. HMSC072B09]
MKFTRSVAAVTIGAATVFGAVAASPAIAQAISCPFAPVHKYEAHRFSGSSTSADAFKVWFNGGVYIEPIVETLDLVDLQVNETQVAYAGDIIYKDENGNFWVK